MRKLLGTIWRLLGRPTRSEPAMLNPRMAAMLARGLAATQEVEYGCAEVYQVLDQYAEAKARGAVVADWMHLVRQHLDMCPDCREEYLALLRCLQTPPAPAC